MQTTWLLHLAQLVSQPMFVLNPLDASCGLCFYSDTLLYHLTVAPPSTLWLPSGFSSPTALFQTEKFKSTDLHLTKDFFLLKKGPNGKLNSRLAPRNEHPRTSCIALQYH